MPTISTFYGITIHMYYSSVEHNPPHFHARYQNYNGTFNMNGVILKGNIPQKQCKLIEEWCLQHKDELMKNWELAMQDITPNKIAPLK